MSDATISIAETPEGYLLTRSAPDGSKIDMPLTIRHVLELAQSAISLRTGAAKRLQPRGMGAEALVSAPLEYSRVEIDSLRENLLVEMRTPQGGQVIYSVPPNLARQLVDQLVVRMNEVGWSGSQN